MGRQAQVEVGLARIPHFGEDLVSTSPEPPCLKSCSSEHCDCGWAPMTSLNHTTTRRLEPPFTSYELDRAYDEMFEPSGVPRPSYRALHERLCEMAPQELRRRQLAADASFLHQGIKFTVYCRDEGTEKIFPYDVLPRIITSSEWATIERGLTQRITALNLFLKDLYHDGKILKDEIVPREMVYTCRHYRRE